MAGNAHALEENIPYERELRVLGARLDDDACRQVRFLEVGDGFLVSSEQNLVPGEPTDSLVKHDDLRRGKIGDLHPGRRGHRDPSRPRYKDVLGALGQQLERDRAYTLLFDEVDDSFVVTYQFCNAEMDYMLHKKHLIVERKDVPNLIRAAKEGKSFR
jgi:hypothetical protein